MKKFWYPLGLIFLITTIVYFPTLDNDFCLDDAVLFESSYPQSGQEVLLLFVEPVQHRLISHYRPVTFLTFAGDHFLWGKNPRGYHFTNIIIAAATASLVFFLIYQFFPLAPACMGALIFSIHPGHSEAVIGIYNRSQLLSTFFMLLALLAIARVIRLNKPNRAWMFFSAGAVLLGCLAKESAIVTPLLAILLIYTEKTFSKHRAKPSEKFSPILIRHLWGGIFWQLVAIMSYLLLRYKAIGSMGMPGVDGFLAGLAPLAIYVNITRIIGEYLRLAFFPFSLSCDYPLIPISFSWMAFLFPLLLGGAFYIFGKGQKKPNKTKEFSLIQISYFASFAFFWFIISLLPVLHILPLQIPLAERLLYPALIGFSFLSASLFQKRFRFFIIFVFLVFSSLTFTRTFDWKDNHTLWTKVQKTHPESYRTLIFFGSEAARQENFDKARQYYIQALQKRPNRNNRILIYDNLATLDFQEKNYLRARLYIQNLFKDAPLYPRAWILLGNIAQKEKNYGEAFNYYHQAQEAPRLTQDLKTIISQKKAEIYFDLQRWPEAYFFYRECLKRDKKDGLLYLRISLSAMRSGKLKEALPYLEKGLELAPKSWQLHYLSFQYYQTQGEKEKAEEHYKKAKKWAPEEVDLPRENG